MLNTVPSIETLIKQFNLDLTDPEMVITVTCIKFSTSFIEYLFTWLPYGNGKSVTPNDVTHLVECNIKVVF